jgi:hypothetical protein
VTSHAKRFLARLDAGEKLPTSYPCPVQLVRLGDDLVLAAIGGETCVDYSLQLKKELAGKAAVWVAGYSNDVMGYIPSRRVREEGGTRPPRRCASAEPTPPPGRPRWKRKSSERSTSSTAACAVDRSAPEVSIPLRGES